MKYPVHISKRAAAAFITVAAMTIAVGLLISARSHGQSAPATTAQQAPSNSGPSSSEPALELSSSQLNAIKIEPVGTSLFPVEEDAVGNIDFDGDLLVQVFPLYQGTIIQTFVALSAPVQKDQPLYTIKSPDLIQAESNLIGAAATFDLTNKEMARVESLSGPNGVSQRELEQATSDQQTAEGALKAAHDAVRVFGKTDAEIDQMIASRRIDPALVVRSPISGKVTSKNAQPGFLVQPGNGPAPYTVSDISLKWMLADVVESNISLLHLGQPVQVKVMAYPDRVFKGRLSKIYSAVDPNTHRVTTRSEITDPRDELRPGMLANFVISVRDPVKATSLPANGVVREADGTMTAWVTSDRRHFVQKIVETGLRTDGRVQILAGLQPGELAVSDGAVFLSNMLQAPPTD